MHARRDAGPHSHPAPGSLPPTLGRGEGGQEPPACPTQAKNRLGVSIYVSWS